MVEAIQQLVAQVNMMVVALGGVAVPAHLPSTPPVQDVQVVQVAQPVELLPVGCDRWCGLVAQAYGAAAAGDMVEVTRLASEAYHVPHLFGWALSTMRCESGLNPHASDGYYVGLSQQDPHYWPGRAAAAGFPGRDRSDPVASAFTMLHMRASGYSWSHWPVCGR